MGWFWNKSEDDPFQSLDPKLKEFLQKEQPPEFKPTAQAPAAPTSLKEELPVESSKPLVPPESHFQDGRYAHLWKTYTPLTVLENSIKSDSEKLRDVVADLNARRSDLGRVALENCAFENMAVHECYRHGKFSDRMMVCRTQVRALDRCYTMQAKFLKALGYLTVVDATWDDMERIQMHADKLYHQMLEQEEIIAKAKSEGKNIPQFAPILSAQSINAAMNGKLVPAIDITEQSLPQYWDDISASLQSEFRERLKNKTGVDRELELRAINAEVEARRSIAPDVIVVFEEESKRRALRREAGQETFGDALKRWWGWK